MNSVLSLDWISLVITLSLRYTVTERPIGYCKILLICSCYFFVAQTSDVGYKTKGGLSDMLRKGRIYSGKDTEQSGHFFFLKVKGQSILKILIGGCKKLDVGTGSVHFSGQRNHHHHQHNVLLNEKSSSHLYPEDTDRQCARS